MRVRKKLKKALGFCALSLGLWSSQPAHAVNNPDSIVVSVTPGGLTYGVAISSPFVQGYQFGTVTLGATTISTVGITVQNSGNVGEYFAMKVANSSPDGWTPGGSAGSNIFKMMAYMNATEPADATFVDTLTGSFNGTSGNLFGQGNVRTTPTNTKNLWLRLTMPTSVTGSGSAQTMTVFVNGQAS